jgi:BMFP domain-containing protein YqiC
MPSRIFDDVTRLAGDAATALNGIKSEVETAVKSRIERALADLDVVPREEFETVRAMAILAREEQEKLAARIAALEAQLAEKAAPKPVKKPKADAQPGDTQA